MLSEPKADSRSPAQLRRCAEDRLAQQQASRPTAKGVARTPEDAARLLHELEVHQVELEIQNEELCRAQQDLEATRAKYFDLYDLAPVGYVTLDVNGLIREANLRASTLLGTPRNALVGKPLSRFILPEDQDIFNRQHLQLVRAGLPQGCAVRLRQSGGDLVWVWLVMTDSQDDASGSPCCRVTLTDITERKQAEESLRRSEEFKDAILNSMASHIAVLDHDGTIVAVNAPWQRFARENSIHAGEPARNTGVGANYLEVCRQSLSESAAEATAAYDGIRAVLEGRVPSFALEYSCGSPHAQRWFALMVTPLGGAGHGVVVAHSDITAHKLAEGSVHELSTRLLQLQDGERRRLARELHDTVVQDLAALAINLALLQSVAPKLNPKGKALLADSVKLAEECMQEARTSSYLLHPPILDELGLAGAIRDHADGFASRTGLRVDLELPPDLSRLPRATELTLFRVLQEAMANIFRHSGSRTASISLTQTADQIRMRVRDQGRGMVTSPEPLPGTSYTRGLGVGIMGMRERMRMLGGELQIQSDEHGTTVTATLPRKEEGCQP